MRFLFIIFIFLMCSLQNLKGNDWILQDKTATALNTVTLYPDSTFVKHSNIAYKEGSLFEVIGQTHYEHEDDDQNQKFKWFHVKSTDGKTGWIYGDALAVILPDNSIPKPLQHFNKKKISLGKGFENATIWVASTDGRDNFHKNDFLNPLYKEFYIVITNEHNRSVHIKYGGVSAMGTTNILEFESQDLTDDGNSDFILINSTLPAGDAPEIRNLEIYSIQAGTLRKIFEEKLNLNIEDDVKSPALFKFVEIDSDGIRVAYVDFLNCKNYQQKYKTNIISKTKEKCLEYVTYTYQWSKQRKMYKAFYEESRTAPKAGIKNYGVWLQDTPGNSGRKIKAIQLQDKLSVIKQYEKIVLENGRKKITPYLYIALPSGEQGYVPARQVGFIKMEHDDLLNRYFQNPPLSKNDWSMTIDFVNIALNQNHAAQKN